MDPAEDWQRKHNHFLLNMVIFVSFPSKCRDHYRWNFLKLSIPEVWLLCPAHSRMKLPFYSKWLVRTNHVVHGLIQVSSPPNNIPSSTAENMGGCFPQNEELWLLVTSHSLFIFSGDVRIWKIIICGWSGILNSHFISTNKTKNLGIFRLKGLSFASPKLIAWFIEFTHDNDLYHKVLGFPKIPQPQKIQDHSKISFFDLNGMNIYVEKSQRNRWRFAWSQSNLDRRRRRDTFPPFPLYNNGCCVWHRFSVTP